MARVHVSDQVWADFRASAYPRPLNFVLGELVGREVERYRSRRIREGLVDDRELIEALDRARDLQEDLVTIIARLERLDATWPSPAEKFPP
jgi:hypothetical protein